ncbi:hypothetical protein [Rhizobium leguminosarum]|uniref:hypothetical protein n=1 Tax=Rhizobium leguminosarum TaxID=384 RepID=UPI0021BBEC1B|nr:hypothetical protein [Rhizobium leguminosarum]
MNYLWLFTVAGGAALLGVALGFGMIKQDGPRAVAAIAGAFVVAIGALGLGLYVASAPTAPCVHPTEMGRRTALRRLRRRKRICPKSEANRRERAVH